jgi:hypothetical protein
MLAFVKKNHTIPNHHREVQFSTHLSLSSVKVGELVDPIENSIFAKVHHPVSSSFYGAGV